jgi:hypothetical protein
VRDQLAEDRPAGGLAAVDEVVVRDGGGQAQRQQRLVVALQRGQVGQHPRVAPRQRGDRGVDRPVGGEAGQGAGDRHRPDAARVSR